MGIMMGIMIIAMAAGFLIFGNHEKMMMSHDLMKQKEEQITNEDKNKKESYDLEEKER